MNTADLRDIKAFANIRAMAGHKERFVYRVRGSKGIQYHFRGAPRTLEQILALEFVGGQSNN